MWSTEGFHTLALPLSMVAVTVNVALSWFMTPLSIQFSDKKNDDGGKDVVYLNLNMAHEVWTDIKFQFLSAGQDTVPYLIRLLTGWFLCNTFVFGFLYGLTVLLYQSIPTMC